jgi:hypothetical protein
LSRLYNKNAQVLIEAPVHGDAVELADHEIRRHQNLVAFDQVAAVCVPRLVAEAAVDVKQRLAVLALFPALSLKLQWT